MDADGGPGVREAATMSADIRPDGQVHWQGHVYTSLSTFSLNAKNAVRKSVGIAPPLTADNGWGCVWYRQPGDAGEGKLLCDVWDEWKGAWAGRRALARGSRSDCTAHLQQRLIRSLFGFECGIRRTLSEGLFVHGGCSALRAVLPSPRS